MTREIELSPEFLRQNQEGSIEAITGCMFSGKTDELIRRLERIDIALKFLLRNDLINHKTRGEYIRVFKPSIDTRYSENNVDSHRGTSFSAIPLDMNNPAAIYEHITDNTRVVAIDEAQFFSQEVVHICRDLASKGIRVIVAGLDTNFRGETFGPMGDLLAQADISTKLNAVCVVCGKGATRTQRYVNGKPAYYEDPEMLVGASEFYEARCRTCHDVPHRENGEQAIPNQVLVD
jgi:thymidine kinase